MRTIADFESGKREPIYATKAAIRVALEAAGVQFIPENGGGPGVRLRKQSMTAYDNAQFRAAIDRKLENSDSETIKSDEEIRERPRDKGLSEAEEIKFTFMVLQARARNLIDRRIAKLDDFARWL